MKKCITCDEVKEVSMFHKHARMADGHLNKCKKCVKEYVDQWRKENPTARKKEHAKRREKLGYKTREEYFKERKEKAIGRSVSSSMYAHKRRKYLSSMPQTEFDEFVMLEALKLREDRFKCTNIKWHVDHIVPLKHKEACGLHNGFNLQVVPARWNELKKNLNMDRYFNY